MSKKFDIIFYGWLLVTVVVIGLLGYIFFVGYSSIMSREKTSSISVNLYNLPSCGLGNTRFMHTEGYCNLLNTNETVDMSGYFVGLKLHSDIYGTFDIERIIDAPKVMVDSKGIFRETYCYLIENETTEQFIRDFLVFSDECQYKWSNSELIG